MRIRQICCGGPGVFSLGGVLGSHRSGEGLALVVREASDESLAAVARRA